MVAITLITSAQKARKGARWSEAEIALAIRLRRDEQLPVPQIASTLGRTTATVYAQLRKFGVVLQDHRVWTQAEIDLALAKIAAGGTYAAAAAAIGRTENELRAKIAYDRIAVPARRAPRVAVASSVKRGDNFSAALRDAIAAERRPLKVIAQEFGVALSALSRLAREIHGRRYRSAASRDASRATIARGRAAKAAKADHAILWTAAAIARLKAAYEAAQGRPDVGALARAFGSTPRMVDMIARRHGFRALQRARRGLTEPAKLRAQALAAAGAPITPAAREIGVDVRTLRAYANSVGLVFEAADRGALAQKAAQAPREARGVGRPVAREAFRQGREALRLEASRLIAEARAEQRAQTQEARAKLRAETRAASAEARRLAALARKAERDRAREAAKAAREQAKKLAEAHAREVKRRALVENVALRPKKAKTAPLDTAQLAALVTAHIATKGVTRVLQNDMDAALAAIRRRGYGVTREGDAYRIDRMTVPAAELLAFAERRGITWKERSVG